MRKQWLFPIGKQKYKIEKQSQNQIHKGSKQTWRILDRFTIGSPKGCSKIRTPAEAYCLHILYKLHKVGNLIWPDEYTTLVKHKIHRP